MRIALSLLLLPCVATRFALGAPLPAESAGSDAANAFALDLYAKLSSQQGNLFLSPFSVSAALAMTYAGARGETAEEMAKVLHLPADPHASFQRLMDEFTASDKLSYELHVANALWLQDRYTFLPEYLSTVEKHYRAGLFAADFVGHAEESRQRINEWVADQTRDKIQDLIGEGVLDASTRLVLTNAIYFKGTWDSAFDKTRTKEQPFHVTPGKSVPTPLMEQQGRFGYLKEAGFQALELGYTGGRLSMVILLPDEVGGLAELEKLMTAESLARWMGALKPQTVSVALPKFKATSEFELNKQLNELGMRAAFSGRADFSGMTGSKELSISAVVHKAFADVNEEGTEAAAATGVVMTKSAIAARPPVFRADHPFIYLIRDVKTGVILFLGRLIEP